MACMKCNDQKWVPASEDPNSVVLCECERKRRIFIIARECEIPERYMLFLNELENRPYQAIYAKEILEYIKNLRVEGRENLVFIGDPWTGKTQYAASIALELIPKVPVFFIRVPELMRIPVKEVKEKLNRAAQSNVVVLDDFQEIGKLTEMLYEFVDHCYSHNISMILTMLGRKEKGLDEIKNQRIRNRLEASSYIIEFLSSCHDIEVLTKRKTDIKLN